MKIPDGFPLFLTLWNRTQNQTTPRVHLKIARWLEARWQRGDTRLLLMAFRSCGKSTIVGLFAAWLLWRHPALRILVLAADARLAAKMVRNTKRIIERHPLTGNLRPDRADQWAADRFTINRPLELRDPSMIAFGIEANITGSRADVTLCDDVEVPNTADTADKRDSLRERLAELSFVLAPGGTQLYVGTPHAFDTIYATKPGDAPDLSPPFLAGFCDLRVPILNAQGKSAWPERFSPQQIGQLRKSGGPRRFGAQMMLQAQPVNEARLSVDHLNWYTAEIEYSEAQGKPVLSIAGTRMASCSAWWDPAFGLGGDASVIAVVFGDEQGEYWLHHLAYLKIDPLDVTDEATQQARLATALCKKFYLPSLTLEINGIGRFLPSILRREMNGTAAVVEISSHRPKDLRILEAFDAVLAARALHVHRSVAATPFVQEMRDWKPGGRNRDDGLDAVAGALSQQPVRIGSRPGTARQYQSWQHGLPAHTARTDFNILE
jgi:hypothetical protein